MAARRADTPPPVLRLVRDGEGVAAPADEPISEDFCFGRKGTTTVRMKTARQFVIPRAVPFLALVAAGEPRARRDNCAAAPPPRRRPRQFDLIERHQHLVVLGSRPRSIGRKRLTRKERRELAELTTFLKHGKHYFNRPKTWGECQERIAGPCPWVSCRHHMFLEVDERTGVIKLNFPGKSITELEETCSLRAAQSGGDMTLERIGELLNITLERSRQIEEVALEKGKARAALLLGEE